MVIGAMAVMITAATSAVFTDTVTSTANSFGSGTLVAQLTDVNETSLDAVAGSITMANIAPGDHTTAPLTVENNGTLALKYTVATSLSAGNAPLATAIQLKIIAIAPGSCNEAAFSSSPTLLYSGALSAGVLSTRYLSGSSQVVDADGTFPAAGGADAPLKDEFCLRTELPVATTDQSLGGVSATVTFTVTAEQRANNP